jgi:hypothetical protein
MFIIESVEEGMMKFDLGFSNPVGRVRDPKDSWKQKYYKFLSYELTIRSPSGELGIIQVVH